MSILITEADLTRKNLRSLFLKVIDMVYRVETMEPMSNRFMSVHAKIGNAREELYEIDACDGPRRAVLKLGEALQEATGDYTLFLDALALQIDTKPRKKAWFLV